MSVPADDLRFIYVTAKDVDEARAIARTLLAEKHIACANIVPKIESVYEWQGETRVDSEAVLILKTTAVKTAAAIARVEELHSYETPCALAFALDTGSERYARWLREQVQ